MTFDFHRAQARARRRTWLLRAVLAAFLGLILVATVGILWSAFEEARIGVTLLDLDPYRRWAAVGVFVVGAGMVVGAVRAFLHERDALLSGPRVARMLRAREVPARATSEAERVLRNVTEEIAVAAGLPAPRLYLLPRQPGINALAVGPDVARGSVFVSEAAAQNLSRPALQAVVAHEIAHLAVGDAALHAATAGAAAALRASVGVVGLAAGWLKRSFSGQTEENLTAGFLAAAFGPALILWVCGFLAGSLVPGLERSVLLVGIGLPLLGVAGWGLSRAMDLAVSHQTEYGADALAVELTRDPEGLAEALTALRDTALAGLIVHAPVERLKPFFFARPYRVPGFVEGLFESHPTPQKRLAELRAFQTSRPWRTQRARSLAPRTVRSDAGPVRRPVAASPLEAAGALLDALPAPLREAAHDPALVESLAYALLLDGAAEIRLKQHAALGEASSSASADGALALFESLATLPRAARLPLAEIALPAMRRLGAPARARLLRTADALAHADGRLSVAELALTEAFRRSLSPASAPTPMRRRASPERVLRAAAPILSALASAGAPSPEARRAAYVAGAGVLARHVPGALGPLRAVGRDAFRGALDALAGADGAARDAVLEAALAVSLADGRTTDAEADLVRLLALAFGQPCPLPPPRLPVPSAPVKPSVAVG